MSKSKWSEEELRLLKEVYGTLSVKELIREHFPNKTVQSIKWQVEKYKLGHKDLWREVELEALKILRNNGMAITKIAAILNRTEDSVRVKASKVGLTFKDKVNKNFDNSRYVEIKSKSDGIENRLLGSINEEYVKIKLSEEGFEVCTPFMNNHPTDLIVLFESIAIKIQIKSGVYDVKGNRFRVNLKTKDKNGVFIQYKQNDVDFFIIKCNGINDYYVIPFFISESNPHIYLYPHRKKIDMGEIDSELFKNAFHLIKGFKKEGEKND